MPQVKAPPVPKSAHPVRDFFVGAGLLLLVGSLATHAVTVPGGGGGRPPGHGRTLTGDPCPPEVPGDTVIREWHFSDPDHPFPEANVHATLNCRVLRRIRDGLPKGTRASTIEECIGKVLRGGERTFADRVYTYTLRSLAYPAPSSSSAVVSARPGGEVLDLELADSAIEECAAA